MYEILLEDIRRCTDKDQFIIILNKLGFMKFGSVLPPQYREKYDPSKLPTMYMNISENTIRHILELEKLLLYTKGIELKLYGPHGQRRLIEFITNKILDFIGKSELVHVSNVLMELVDNAEKANFFYVLSTMDIPLDPETMILKKRAEVVEMCKTLDKWVKISWKFSSDIFKIEVSNNVPMDYEQARELRKKTMADISSIVDGVVEEDNDENKIGAGLGLYFVKFFIDDLKQKDIEVIFRIYSSDKTTFASLTMFFEKF